MSIHDVNYTSNNRAGAKPSVHDTLQQRIADGTTSITNNPSGEVRPRVETKEATIAVFDGDVYRILIGSLPDGSYGMIISKPGVDVYDVVS